MGPDAKRRLIGVDATFRYRPLRRAIYSRFNARTELVWSRQDSRASLRCGPSMAGVAEYQFARRWYIGRASIDRGTRLMPPVTTAARCS